MSAGQEYAEVITVASTSRSADT